MSFFSKVETCLNNVCRGER